jgi:hypothetical protein
LENYREFLSTNEDSKGKKNISMIFIEFLILELSLKPAEDLLNELSFLSKKKFVTEVGNQIVIELKNRNFILNLVR